MSSAAKQSKQGTASKMRLRMWLRLLKVSRRMETEIRENLRTEFGSTLPRFDVMAALSQYAEKGLKMSELSEVLRVSNGNVTGIVERLVKDDLVVRIPVENDRRVSLVRLTQKGNDTFARQAVAHAGWIDQLLCGFSGADAENISTRLEDVIKMIDKEEGDK